MTKKKSRTAVVHKKPLHHYSWLLTTMVAGVVLTGVLLVVLMRQPVSQQVRVTTLPSGPQVSISNDGFLPAVIKIKVGDSVTWTNTDTAAHLVAANPFPSHSELPSLNARTGLAKNQSYIFTFTTAGTYNYHDDFNPSLNGTVIVD